MDSPMTGAGANSKQDGPPGALCPALVPILHVGLKDVPGGVACLPENTLAYVTGKSVATHSTLLHRVWVSEPCRDVRSISAMAVSQDRKWIAVAETTAGTRPPQVSILSVDNCLERLGVQLRGPSADRYHALAFSGDGKLLVACSQLADDLTSIFHVWEWQVSSEPTSSGTFSGKAVKATINPKFPANVVVQSHTDLAYLRLGSSGYRQHPLDGLKKQSGQAGQKATFVDHTWLADGQLVVAMSNRRLLILEGVEVQAVVILQRVPTCLAAMADGYLLVATSHGCVELYRPNIPEGSTNSHLTLHATLMMPDAGLGGGVMGSSERSITQLSLEPGTERVVCYIKYGPVFMLNTRLAKTSAFRNNAATAEAMWEQLLPGMHAGSIVSASLAVRKELVATASDDLTVRVWGIRPLRLVATHLCHHLPLAVAMDPGASELVVAYVDCVRLYSVVEGMLLEIGGLYLPSRMPSGDGTEEAIPTRELSKVSIVSYSPTGHMLALVGGVSNKEVLVFSALHRSLLARLSGHYSTVQDLAWSDDGLYLCTVSDGAVYTWHMEGFRRLQEDTTKGHNNNCVAATPDFGHLVVGESLQGLRMLATSRAKRRMTSEDGDGEEAKSSPFASAAAGAKPGQDNAMKPGMRPSSLAKPGAGGNPTRHSSNLGPKNGNTNNGGDGDQNGFRFPPPSSYNATNSPRPGVRKPGGDMELDLLVPAQPVALPIRGGVVVCMTPEYQAVVCAGAMGCLRVTTLPLRSQHHYQEYTVHSADITVIRAHFRGRLVLSGDAGGCWVLHQLVAPDKYRDMSAALTTRQAVSRAPSANRDASARRDGSPRRASKHHLIGLDPSLMMPSSAPTGDDSEEAGGIVGRGTVMLPLPPYPKLAELARAEASVKPTDGQEGSYDVLTVRAVDMHILQDTLREAREQLAKSATAADYKAYEREQEVRRAIDEEIGQCRRKMEEAEDRVRQAQAAAAAEAKAARSHVESLKAQHQADLEAERDRLESRLASEISRTNAAEHEVQRIKAKFGKKLFDVEGNHKQEVLSSHDKIALLKAQTAQLQRDTQAQIGKASDQMETEMRLGHEIAEEEVGRIQDYSQGQVEERDERYLRLLAKHTLETGLASKTAAQNEELKATNEQLTAEKARLTEQVRGLSDELHAMHTAWADRDVKQRMQDAELKEVSRQASQGQMYTGLATDRITALTEELESLQKAKKEAVTLAHNLEGAQVRQAEKHIKFQAEHETLKSRMQYLQGELTRVKLHAKQRDEYFDNFANQLYRVVHNVNPDEWAQLFGRLHADFVAGKDKLDWGSYRSPAAQTSTVEKVVHQARKAGAQERTVEELKTQLREMHAQVMHTERMMNLTRDTCEKERVGFKGLISRLQADNIQVLSQLNEAKRDLKLALEDADIQRSELHTQKMMAHSSSSSAIGRHSHSAQAAPGHVTASLVAGADGAWLGEDSARTSHTHLAAAARFRRGTPHNEPTSLGPSAPSTAGEVAPEGLMGTRPSTSQQALHKGPPLSRLGSSTTGPLVPPTPPLEGTLAAHDFPGARPQTSPGTDISSLFPPSRQTSSRPATSLSASMPSPSGLTRPPTSTVTGEMPKGGWWLEPHSLFDPSSSLGMIRHLDIAGGAAKRPPTSGTVPGGAGGSAAARGKRAGLSRGGSAGAGPSPPMAPCTPAAGTRSCGLGPGLEPFGPYLQQQQQQQQGAGEGGAQQQQQQQQLQQQLHQFYASQVQQHQQQASSRSARSAPSWRPGVPVAEMYASIPPPTSPISRVASSPAARTSLGSRQGQQQQPQGQGYGPGGTALGLTIPITNTIHAASPHGRPQTSSPPRDSSPPKNAASSESGGPGSVYVAGPGGMHALTQPPSPDSSNTHPHNHHHHHTPFSPHPATLEQIGEGSEPPDSPTHNIMGVDTTAQTTGSSSPRTSPRRGAAGTHTGMHIPRGQQQQQQQQGSAHSPSSRSGKPPAAGTPAGNAATGPSQGGSRFSDPGQHLGPWATSHEAAAAQSNTNTTEPPLQSAASARGHTNDAPKASPRPSPRPSPTTQQQQHLLQQQQRRPATVHAGYSPRGGAPTQHTHQQQQQQQQQRQGDTHVGDSGSLSAFAAPPYQQQQPDDATGITGTAAVSTAWAAPLPQHTQHTQQARPQTSAAILSHHPHAHPHTHRSANTTPAAGAAPAPSASTANTPHHHHQHQHQQQQHNAAHARPHTSSASSSPCITVVPGAGGPSGSLYPHSNSNSTVPPRLSTMGGGFRSFVPRQQRDKVIGPSQSLNSLDRTRMRSAPRNL